MKNLIVVKNNSVSNVSDSKNMFLYFFGPGRAEEKEIRVGRAWQAAAAAAACDASISFPIPRCSAEPGAARALAGRAKEVSFPAVRAASSAPARSAGACGYRAVGASLPSACQPRKRRAKCEAASISFPVPWSTRSDSGAGGGRLPDAAQEVAFPASRASFNSAGASERSACQPRQRRAKGDAASIRCGIPCCTRSASGAGGGRLADAAKEGIFPLGVAGDSFRGRKFYRFGCEALENTVMNGHDERIKELPDKINEGQPCRVGGVCWGLIWDALSVPNQDLQLVVSICERLAARNFALKM